MNIKFGLEIGEQAYPFIDEERIYCNENTILSLLEKYLGIGSTENFDFLRIEQYRQALLQYLNSNKDAFYAESFRADSLATAESLLYRRDELKLNGFEFNSAEKMPERLAIFSAIEKIIRQMPNSFNEGYADRFEKLWVFLAESITNPIEKIYLQEPLSLLPNHIKRLFDLLVQKGSQLFENEISIDESNTDLNNFKKALNARSKSKFEAEADGSIIIMQCSSDSFAAAYLAKLFSKNEAYRPVCILPDKNRSLDTALIQEGLPSFGVLSASLSRPTLQILKLASNFLWNPNNPYKLLEFLSLPNIPLNRGLAFRLAAAVSEKPGIMSALWFAKKNDFFNDLDLKIEQNPKNDFLLREKKRAEKDYKFWFERKRYDIKTAVPIRDVIEIYNYIKFWALEIAEDFNKKIDRIEQDKIKANEEDNEAEIVLLQSQLKPFSALQEQCKRLILVLESLPENEKMLSYLELERIVRAVYEPTQMLFRQSEIGHLPFVYHSAAILENCENTLWWNFIDNVQNAGYDFWYKSEYEYLSKSGCLPEKPAQRNDRMLWQRKNAILKTTKNILLVIPDQIAGKSVNPHPLWGDLHAAFGKSLKNMVVNPEKNNDALLSTIFNLPDFSILSSISLKEIAPFIDIANNSEKLTLRETETFTGLDSLLNYPYQWVFKYILGLHKSSILSIVRPETLKGNLAHSIFEKLMNETKAENMFWEKEILFNYLEKEIPLVIEKEAVVFMLYGMESERRAFINMMKQSAWALLSAIQNNGWKISGSEINIEGFLGNQALKGKSDLILERGAEKTVVDLKFSGLDHYRNKIKNREDLQLLIYSRFASDTEDWAHRAYFIINKAQLLAPNNLAFKEAEVLLGEEDPNISNNLNWDKLQQTFEWRVAQINAGKIEVRTKKTIEYLDESYSSEDMISMLELPRDSAKYDIYNVLLGTNSEK